MGRPGLLFAVLFVSLFLAASAFAQDAQPPADPPRPAEQDPGADSGADEAADPAQPANEGGEAEKPSEPQNLDFHDAVIGEGGYAELFLRDGARVSVKGVKGKTLFSYRKTDLASGKYALALKRGLMFVRLGKNAVLVETPSGEFAIEGAGSTVKLIVDAGGKSSFSLSKGSGANPNVFYMGCSFAISEGISLEFSPGDGLPADRVEGIPGEWQNPDTMLETSHYVTADDGSVNLNLVGSWNVITCTGDINIGSGFGGGGDALGRGVTFNSGTATFDFSAGGANVFVGTPQGTFSSVVGAQFTAQLPPGGIGMTIVNNGTTPISFEVTVETEAGIFSIPVSVEAGATASFSVSEDGVIAQVAGEGAAQITITVSVDGVPVAVGATPPETAVAPPQAAVPGVEPPPQPPPDSWVPPIEGAGDLDSASPIRPN